LLHKEFLLRETKVKIFSNQHKFFHIAEKEIATQRKIIEDYIKKHPEFEASLTPLKALSNAPTIVKEMCYAGLLAGTGPFAAVAGSISEHACKAMLRSGAETALVENGGDIFVSASKPLKIAFYAGKKHPVNNLCIEINKEKSPIAICSSSSKMGHSISLGNCDLATVFAEQGAVADALATGLCNRVKCEQDLQKAIEWVASFKGVKGAIAVKGKKIALWGIASELELHSDAKIAGKITAH